MIIKPVSLDETDRDSLVDLSIYATAKQHCESILGDGTGHTSSRRRGAGMGSAEQRMDERVQLPTGIERDYRPSGKCVNVSGNPADRCVPSSKISGHSKVSIK